MVSQRGVLFKSGLFGSGGSLLNRASGYFTFWGNTITAGHAVMMARQIAVVSRFQFQIEMLTRTGNDLMFPIFSQLCSLFRGHHPSFPLSEEAFFLLLGGREP